MNYGLDMQLQSIFEDEECSAVFENCLPGVRKMITDSNPIGLTLSVRQLAEYTGGMLPEAALSSLEKALVEIGGRNGGISPAEQKRMETYQAMQAAADAKDELPKIHHQEAVYPGRPWLDVNGNRIQAHAGGFLCENGTYYWYGENKEYTDGKSKIWTWGIRMYASKDFYNWKDCGQIIPAVLDDPNSELFPEKFVDRPHIVKNASTGKYVCWYKNSGTDSCFNVLTADVFTGPWEMVTVHLHPFDMDIGDFDIVVDEESGNAYLYCECNHNTLKGIRLNKDYTDVEEIVSTQYDGINPPFTREGVSVFERNGKLWMLTSGMTGYVPNQSDSAVSDGYEKEFVPAGDPFVGDDTLSSFNSQIAQVFKVPGKTDLYLAVADRWVPEFLLDRGKAMSMRRATAARYYPEEYTATPEDEAFMRNAPMGDTANTGIADYVILPIVFEENCPKIYWRDSWTLEEFD